MRKYTYLIPMGYEEIQTITRFLTLRYGAFVATISALFFTCIPTNYCTAVGIIGQVGLDLVTASAGMLFAFRVFTMWDRHRVVYVVVGLFYFIMVGSWVRLPLTSNIHQEVLLIVCRLRLPHNSRTSTVPQSLLGPIARSCQYMLDGYL